VGPIREAQRAFIDALDGHTLADVVGNRAPRYRRLLNLTRIR
jgi:hypothetical protein